MLGKECILKCFVMKNFIRSGGKKHVVSKLYVHLNQVERAIEYIVKTDDTDTQLTMLVKLGETSNATYPFTELTNIQMETYWRNLLCKNTEIGFFQNPQIGTIFVAGALSEVFLHDINGKKLGAMSGGPYGILRGLGVEEPEAANYIKKLNEGLYLLLVRTSRFDFEGLGNPLEKIA